MKRVSQAFFSISLLALALALSVTAQTDSREKILQDLTAQRAKIAKLEAAYLDVAAEDRAAYAEFLSQPNTGLLRLLPREKFGKGASGYRFGWTMTSRGESP